jgi:hypothetical protein
MSRSALTNSGKLTYGMLDGVLMMINGRALRGMRKLLTEFWHTRDSISLLSEIVS